jgi:hypothetical protein
LKLYPLLLASLLLTALFIPALLAEPCAAAFVPGNNVTLERNGMTWDYDEKTTDNDAIIFRSIIDGEAGDKNGFVNSWEILKMEVILRDRMKKAIEEEPDVKLNSTSDTVELKDVEFCIPEEAIGRINKSSSITSYASVTYSFKEEAGPGTSIWLMGTPDSAVTITLPPGFDTRLTEGLNNKSIGFENNLTVLRGNFSHEKNITVWLSENETLKAKLQDTNMSKEKSVENESDKGENKKLNSGVNSKIGQSFEFLKNILREINQSLI